MDLRQILTSKGLWFLKLTFFDVYFYSFQPSPPVESNEGSGDSYNNFADEDEDDSNFNYDYEGSGNDDEEDAIEDSYSPRQPTDNFQNSRNNYQDPYNTGGNSWNPDPRDPWDTPSNQNNFNTNQQQNNNNFNSQYSPTQQVCFPKENSSKRNVT